MYRNQPAKQELITSGLFGVVRHPIYFFTSWTYWLHPHMVRFDLFVIVVTNSYYVHVPEDTRLTIISEQCGFCAVPFAYCIWQEEADWLSWCYVHVWPLTRLCMLHDLGLVHNTTQG